MRPPAYIARRTMAPLARPRRSRTIPARWSALRTAARAVAYSGSLLRQADYHMHAHHLQPRAARCRQHPGANRRSPNATHAFPIPRAPCPPTLSTYPLSLSALSLPSVISVSSVVKSVLLLRRLAQPFVCLLQAAHHNAAGIRARRGEAQPLPVRMQPLRLLHPLLP